MWKRPGVRWLLLPVAALLLAAATLALALALQRAPAVQAVPAADAASAVPWRQWLQQHDPRRLGDGRVVVLKASATELQMLAGHAARLAGGAARTTLADGRLDLAFSLPLPRHDGWWLNAELRLADGPERPRVLRLKAGALMLPGWMIEPVLPLVLRWWDPPLDGRPPLHTMLQGTRWQRDGAVLAYRWRADLTKRLAGWLVPPAQVQRLRAYHQALADELRHRRGPQELGPLLAPLFTLARQRSAGASADAAAENRAALLMLAVHASGRQPGVWLPAARSWPKLPPGGLTFDGREDFPLHYLVSAVIAAEGHAALSDLLGLGKEIADARGGSGFSFTDMAVNRAGTRLGELALRDPQRVQAVLAAGPDVRTLLPDVSDLPEVLPEAQFVARYGGVDAPAYREVVADIEARVAKLALYR